MLSFLLLISILAPNKPVPKIMCDESCVVAYCYHRCQPNLKNDEAYMEKWRECSARCLDHWEKAGCGELLHCQQDL